MKTTDTTKKKAAKYNKLIRIVAFQSFHQEIYASNKPFDSYLPVHVYVSAKSAR